MSEWIGMLVTAGVTALVVILAIRFWKPDERFKEYRRKSSRFALATGLATLIVLFIYRAATTGDVPWDLTIVLGAIVVGKLGAMTYYQISG